MSQNFVYYLVPVVPVVSIVYLDTPSVVNDICCILTNNSKPTKSELLWMVNMLTNPAIAFDLESLSEIFFQARKLYQTDDEVRNFYDALINRMCQHEHHQQLTKRLFIKILQGQANLRENNHYHQKLIRFLVICLKYSNMGFQSDDVCHALSALRKMRLNSHVFQSFIYAFKNQIEYAPLDFNAHQIALILSGFSGMTKPVDAVNHLIISLVKKISTTQIFMDSEDVICVLSQLKSLSPESHGVQVFYGELAKQLDKASFRIHAEELPVIFQIFCKWQMQTTEMQNFIKALNLKINRFSRLTSEDAVKKILSFSFAWRDLSPSMQNLLETLNFILVRSEIQLSHLENYNIIFSLSSLNPREPIIALLFFTIAQMIKQSNITMTPLSIKQIFSNLAKLDINILAVNALFQELEKLLNQTSIDFIQHPDVLEKILYVYYEYAGRASTQRIHLPTIFSQKEALSQDEMIKLFGEMLSPCIFVTRRLDLKLSSSFKIKAVLSYLDHPEKLSKFDKMIIALNTLEDFQRENIVENHLRNLEIRDGFWKKEKKQILEHHQISFEFQNNG